MTDIQIRDDVRERIAIGVNRAIATEIRQLVQVLLLEVGLGGIIIIGELRHCGDGIENQAGGSGPHNPRIS